jgi:hypothetical protein
LAMRIDEADAVIKKTAHENDGWFPSLASDQ